MRRFLIIFGSLFLSALAFAGQGQGNTLTVSSGTFKAIQGFGNNSGNFVQGVAVADSSYTVTAPVDPVNGLAVYLATSTLTTTTAVRIDGSATTISPYVITTIGDGFKVIPTAGTRVVLAASTASKEATVCSDPTNTGVLAVGGTSVVAAAGTRQGVPLSPGDCYTVRIDNLNDINIDTTVSGSTATYSYQN